MRQLHEAFDGDLPVILVSASQTDAFDRMAGLMLGADDYLSKPLDAGELLARVKRSLRRAEPHVTRNGDSHARVENAAGLSPREREILGLLAEGRTQGQIAGELVISSKTVATHIQHILSKLGVNTRAQAVAWRSGAASSSPMSARTRSRFSPPGLTRGGSARGMRDSTESDPSAHRGG